MFMLKNTWQLDTDTSGILFKIKMSSLLFYSSKSKQFCVYCQYFCWTIAHYSHIKIFVCHNYNSEFSWLDKFKIQLNFFPKIQAFLFWWWTPNFLFWFTFSSKSRSKLLHFRSNSTHCKKNDESIKLDLEVANAAQ